MDVVLLVVCIYVAAVLETALGRLWEVGGAGPELLLIVALTWSTAAPVARRVFAAAIIGLASDLGSAAPIGLGLATYSLAAYGVFRIEKDIAPDRLIARWSIIGVAATAVAFVQGLAVYWGLGQSSWQDLLGRAVTVGLFTAAIAIPVLMIQSWRRRPMNDAASFL